MSYLGNTPAARFSAMAKQTITGDGGTGYTLTHAVGNEQEIEVFVNNVRQEPGSGKAYTVSGTTLTMTGNVASTDDFYVVYQGKAQQTATHPPTFPLTATTGTFSGGVTANGGLNVATIKDSTGTNTAITIDSSGDLTMSQASVDFWRLSANFTTNGATITGWERPDDGYNAAVNGLTESSGIFTFTKTGLYKIDMSVLAQNATSGDGSFGAIAFVSSDSGGSYDQAALTYSGDTDTGSNNSSSLQFVVNVTDISTYRIKFLADSLSSGTFISGVSTHNTTCFSCIKFAPAQ